MLHNCALHLAFKIRTYESQREIEWEKDRERESKRERERWKERQNWREREKTRHIIQYMFWNILFYEHLSNRNKKNNCSHSRLRFRIILTLVLLWIQPTSLPASQLDFQLANRTIDYYCRHTVKEYGDSIGIRATSLDFECSYTWATVHLYIHVHQFRMVVAPNISNWEHIHAQSYEWQTTPAANGIHHTLHSSSLRIHQWTCLIYKGSRRKRTQVLCLRRISILRFWI